MTKKTRVNALPAKRLGSLRESRETLVKMVNLVWSYARRGQDVCLAKPQRNTPAPITATVRPPRNKTTATKAAQMGGDARKKNPWKMTITSMAEPDRRARPPNRTKRDPNRRKEVGISSSRRPPASSRNLPPSPSIILASFPPPRNSPSVT